MTPRVLSNNPAPRLLQIATSYNGLSGPYTYSDMTGWGLQNAACNPEG